MVAGLATASSAVGLDFATIQEQFPVPVSFSLMPLGAGSLFLEATGI